MNTGEPLYRIRITAAASWRLRKLTKTRNGRARVRERVAVEHSLAHLGRRQGRRAR